MGHEVGRVEDVDGLQEQSGLGGVAGDLLQIQCPGPAGSPPAVKRSVDGAALDRGAPGLYVRRRGRVSCAAVSAVEGGCPQTRCRCGMRRMRPPWGGPAWCRELGPSAPEGSHPRSTRSGGQAPGCRDAAAGRVRQSANAARNRRQVPGADDGSWRVPTGHGGGYAGSGCRSGAGPGLREAFLLVLAIIEADRHVPGRLPQAASFPARSRSAERDRASADGVDKHAKLRAYTSAAPADGIATRSLEYSRRRHRPRSPALW